MSAALLACLLAAPAGAAAVYRAPLFSPPRTGFFAVMISALERAQFLASRPWLSRHPELFVPALKQLLIDDKREAYQLARLIQRGYDIPPAWQEKLAEAAGRAGRGVADALRGFAEEMDGEEPAGGVEGLGRQLGRARELREQFAGVASLYPHAAELASRAEARVERLERLLIEAARREGRKLELRKEDDAGPARVKPAASEK